MYDDNIFTGPTDFSMNFTKQDIDDNKTVNFTLLLYDDYLTHLTEYQGDIYDKGPKYEIPCHFKAKKIIDKKVSRSFHSHTHLWLTGKDHKSVELWCDTRDGGKLWSKFGDNLNSESLTFSGA
ncbi:uncharacterized protein L201_005307 [Kwoniella dendrophila CBS 6074]|uniref:Uncharacterized protein n=1 Tax=Kwoniella dendrophila CBS 6074 TaxID=1295534 RepID=A0AAX4JYV2_9TREE